MLVNSDKCPQVFNNAQLLQQTIEQLIARKIKRREDCVGATFASIFAIGACCIGIYGLISGDGECGEYGEPELY